VTPIFVRPDLGAQLVPQLVDLALERHDALDKANQHTPHLRELCTCDVHPGSGLVFAALEGPSFSHYWVRGEAATIDRDDCRVKALDARAAIVTGN
jgi:hypothetical protein